MTFVGLLVRLAIIYLLVRFIWKALAPRRRVTTSRYDRESSMSDDIVDAEWVDLEEDTSPLDSPGRAEDDC
jgi:hypothetical protein